MPSLLGLSCKGHCIIGLCQECMTHLLGCNCIGHCIAGGPEGNDKRISLGGNFVAAEPGEMHSHDTIMQTDGFHHGSVIPLPHLRAAFHIRAYQRDAGLNCR